MKALLVVLLGLFAPVAVADLYRWVDPETGSVKFSSLPPPWLGDPEQERRAPKVEVIPSAGSRPAPVAPAATPASAAAAAKPAAAAEKPPAPGALAALEQRFKSLLQTFAGLPTDYDFERAASGMQQHMQAYEAVSAELDRLDPKGAERRRAQTESTLSRFLKGVGAAASTKPPLTPGK